MRTRVSQRGTCDRLGKRALPAYSRANLSLILMLDIADLDCRKCDVPLLRLSRIARAGTGYVSHYYMKTAELVYSYRKANPIVSSTTYSHMINHINMMSFAGLIGLDPPAHSALMTNAIL